MSFFFPLFVPVHEYGCFCPDLRHDYLTFDLHLMSASGETCPNMRLSRFGTMAKEKESAS